MTFLWLLARTYCRKNEEEKEKEGMRESFSQSALRAELVITDGNESRQILSMEGTEFPKDWGLGQKIGQRDKTYGGAARLCRCT
jgi:hypothetical protein